MPTVVNLDGRLVEPAEARVSVFDRGFLQGDSVYEVLRTYRGRLFEPQAHLTRLARSAARARLDLPWDAARCVVELERTVAASLGGDPADPAAAPWNGPTRGFLSDALRLVVRPSAARVDAVVGAL